MIFPAVKWDAHLSPSRGSSTEPRRSARLAAARRAYLAQRRRRPAPPHIVGAARGSGRPARPLRRSAARGRCRPPKSALRRPRPPGAPRRRVLTPPAARGQSISSALGQPGLARAALENAGREKVPEGSWDGAAARAAVGPRGLRCGEPQARGGNPGATASGRGCGAPRGD